MKSVVLKGIGVILSFYLSDRELETIGMVKKCCKCNGQFKVGDCELDKAKLTYKGSPKKKLDVWLDVGDEFPENHEFPIGAFGKISDFSKQEQAIIYGVECLNHHLCLSCCNKNTGVEAGYDSYDVIESPCHVTIKEE